MTTSTLSRHAIGALRLSAQRTTTLSTSARAFHGPYPWIVDMGCDCAAVGSVAARRAS